MRKVPILILMAVLAMPGEVWAAAAANINVARGFQPHACRFPKTGAPAPGWICTARVRGLAIAAVGSSPRSGAGNAFMEQMAAADARVHLARKLGRVVQGRIDGNHRLQAKEDKVLTSLANESLADTRIIRSIYSPDGTLYVLVGLDAAHAEQMIDSVSSSYLERKHP